MSLEDLPVVGAKRFTAKELAKPAKGTIKRNKQRDDRDHKRAREKCRLEVFTADRGRCRRCDKKVWLKPSQAPHELRIANIHEWPPRSLGGDDTNPLQCITFCGDCHPLFTEHKLDIVALDEQRLLRGPVEFIPGGNA